MYIEIRTERRTHIWPLALSFVAGAGLAYLLDPDRGRRRRAMAGERTTATIRRGGRQIGRAGRRLGASIYGWKQKLMHLRPADTTAPDDVTLTHRVESVLFRDPDVPKGRINVNCERGIVVLRGELDREDQLRALAAQARKVPGVRDVENLLHLAGTAAPNKADARRASQTGMPGSGDGVGSLVSGSVR